MSDTTQLQLNESDVWAFIYVWEDSVQVVRRALDLARQRGPAYAIAALEYAEEVRATVRIDIEERARRADLDSPCPG